MAQGRGAEPLIPHDVLKVPDALNFFRSMMSRLWTRKRALDMCMCVCVCMHVCVCARPFACAYTCARARACVRA
eukprot:4428921-Alexandrium_andersonii.AAC.1